MQILDPISIPLNQANLIEASAGTGKTYTMANLYLRLILGVGCEPLMVEQILVVTFTKAATQELRDRIRAKLKDVAKWFADPESADAQNAFREPFIAELYQAVQPNLSEALLRLRIAEREMDLATIFTIDSFCQKMLFQYAFDSGVRLDIELKTDESELLQRLSEQTWRELFYPLRLAETEIIVKQLGTPNNALEQVKPYLSDILQPTHQDELWAKQSISAHLSDFNHFVAEFKQYWLENRDETVSLIQQEITKKYKTGEKKSLNRSSYKKNLVERWESAVNDWAKDKSSVFPAEQFARFCQNMIVEKADEGAEPLLHSRFAENQAMLDEYLQRHNQIKSFLLYKFLHHFRAKLAAYKNSHLDKNFTDILVYFHQALHGKMGDALASKVRNQFRFAMIDESQDTNQIQYQIFKKIFLENSPNHGFIMIGDPKQSIYKFRGADIFSYLDAAKQVQQKFTLPKNWRSLPKVVETVNQLFTLNGSDAFPFLYNGIKFSPVESKSTDEKLLNGEQETNIYFLPTAYKTEDAAEHCAAQIQKQLTKAQQGIDFIGNDENARPLEPKDVAILVRSHSEATLIKNALAKRQLQSVYLSERNSVYQSNEAKDLQRILQACLNPYHAKLLLAALGTSLWGLSSAEIFQLKQSETAWENQVEKMVAYQQIWQYQGILPMLHKLFRQEGIVERLNAQTDTDRRLTNILHLAELLQQKMDTAENESALLRWFSQQIENPKEEDEQLLRLESEENLIKIVTIHKSKGLEYPVVWLPFIAKKAKGASSQAMSLYRDNDQQLQWDFNSGNEQITKWRNQEEYAEDLRLLYVALTRAKYQLQLILPAKWGKEWNAMHYLLGNGTVVENTDSKTALAEKGIEYQGVDLPEQADETPFIATTNAFSDVQASQFEGKIQETGQVTSFTALQRQNEYLQNSAKFLPVVSLNDDAQDYDKQAVQTGFEDQAQFSPYSFPHSTKVGNILHRFLEHLDFTQPVSTEQILPICEQLQLSEEWLEPLKIWIEQVLNTPFSDNEFCLADISLSQRLNEWQFYLRLKNRNALPRLNRLLKQHSPLALPELRLTELDGFVRGFVDCIVQKNGRFYVLDYKSNFLGGLPQDYATEQLAQTIVQYRYDLQYLLYSLAVHRYLRSRLGENYDYQRDFGGVAYLFLRGMNSTAHQGVFFDKPSLALINELDQLFG